MLVTFHNNHDTISNTNGHEIRELMTECQYYIKGSSGISELFLSTSSVKQGCNLSPTLANIYQNDLHDIFDELCAPVKLADMPLSSMSWVDDLILLAESAEGLQRSLDKLTTRLRGAVLWMLRICQCYVMNMQIA